MTSVAKKRRGRPAREPDPGERVKLGLRVTPVVKRQLDAAAESSGRSQSQEAELRLEQSFEREAERGGAEITAVARIMAEAFRLGGSRGARATKHPKWTPAQWMNDPFCYTAGIMAVIDALNAHQPVHFKSEHPNHEVAKAQEDMLIALADAAAKGKKLTLSFKDDKGGKK